ncbi:MAG TPA: hypothetical protein VLC52_08875 [Anaerolineae bacterium]|nr:hypothetical protein [Anaerolineae bacterium]
MHNRLSLALLVLLLSIGVLSSAQARPEESLVAAPGSVLSPEIQLSRGSTGLGEDWYGPAAAYNALRHSQIVFTHAHSATGGDIYGYYWSAIPNDWTWFWAMNGVQPAVAYNRTEDDFLLVSMYDSDQNGRYEIWGMIVQGDASAKGASFLIFQWPDRSFWSPRVVWNSYHNEYLVVWNAVDTTTGLPNDVAAARVSASGAVLSAPHVIADVGTPHQADVAYNLAADEYLVVWRRHASDADWDIYGARLRGSDAELISPPGWFTVSAPVEDQRSPAVATNQQGHYMVVWEYAYPGPCCDWDIRGQELDVGGAAVGGVINVAQTTDDETNRRVVARPGPQRDYVAVWQKGTLTGSEIWASRWGADVLVPDYFQVAAAAWWDHASPAVAATGARYLFAYEADSQGDPTQFRHIYGRYWTPNVVFLPMVLRNRP